MCAVDPGILYEPGGAPDGGDAIVNDTVYAHRLAYLMQKVDGSWKLASVAELGSAGKGWSQCPPAG